MISFSTAKINLGLYITAKRNDGYHTIESIFLPVDLQDGVELIKADTNSLTIYGAEIPGDKAKNSSLQALELMQKKFSVQPYAIHLFKRIPIGAGLGGGSGNASKVITMINQIEQLALSIEQMEALALKIGSDNAFFIENKPKFVTGRGEILEAIDLQIQSFKVAIIHPPIYLSTAAAYDNIPIKKPTLNLRQLELSHLLNQSVVVKNVFELPFLQQYPETSSILFELKQSGAFHASLSGSGSAFYGLFTPNQNIPKKLEQFADKKGYGYYETTII